MIDQPTIDRILDTANIVDVVSEYVTLSKRGVNYVGLCPFHSDKTPSFYVSPSKNICKCFACGEGGTAVHFIMKHEQVTYFDALRQLAKKYNIEIQERELTDKEKQVRSDRESMLIVNNWAQQYFTTQLFEHEEGRSIGLRYFIERGFREDIIRKFQLGYSLEQRDALYQAATKSGYQKEFLEKTGLAIAYDGGRMNDRFRGRVIFPIHTLSGKVVGFGGRILKKDEKTAKYVNSPESEIYHKSNELYGIFFAKQSIVKEDLCYLVEGYTDVISMHQAGIENVVASSGTALTQGQIRLIRRFTNNITVLYDGDAAGIKAAIRGIDMLLEEGMNIRVLLLPDKEDPDSFARKRSASEFTSYIKQNETDFIRFKTRLLLEDAGSDPIKRSALIKDIVYSVSIIPDNIARSLYIRECSSMLEVDEGAILTEVNKLRLIKEEKRTPPVITSSTPSDPNIPPTHPGFNAYPADAPESHPYAPENFSPPPLEGKGTELSGGLAAQIQSAQQSPFEVHERTLLRYIVRYGERAIFSEDEVEEIKEGDVVVSTRIIHNPEATRVSSYILEELQCDDLTFTHPLYRQMLLEAAGRCTVEGFSARRYFLHHPDQAVSQLAANLISDKYQLSKYHSKYRVLELEEDKLEMLILYELYALKEAYVNRQIKELHAQIKEVQDKNDMETILSLMKEIVKLNDIKSTLCKELGERIVLKK